MNNGYYNSNQRVFSYDRNNPRMNNQYQLVHPTNNIRKIDNSKKIEIIIIIWRMKITKV